MSSRIHKVNIPGTWLREQELWLGLIKPPVVAVADIIGDHSRPEAVALIDAALGSTEHGQQHLVLKSLGQPALVLVPEYALGSGDFAAVDTIVRRQNNPLILLAGFGASRGATLRAMVNASGVHCGWPEGLSTIDDDAIYNGGWCWVHDSRADRHQCILFLKNWAEQKHERAGFPVFVEGNAVLQLATDDCDFFAMICADALCNRALGPHEQVAAFLRTPDTKHCVVSVLMLEEKPHNVWPTRLDQLMGAARRPTALVTCNHVSVPPQVEDQQDNFRCMSGALLALTKIGGDGFQQNAHSRRLRSGGTAGFVLRSSEPGVAGGRLVWDEIGLENPFAWMPNWRQTWSGGTLHAAVSDAYLVECIRWCNRIPRPNWMADRDTSWKLVQLSLKELAATMKAWPNAVTVWPGVVSGLGFEKPENAELADPAIREAVQKGIFILATAGAALKVPLQSSPNGWHFLRPATAEDNTRAFIVWSSISSTAEQQWQTLQVAALDWQLPHSTVVVGRADAGTPPSAQRVKPDQFTDYPSVGEQEDDDDIGVPPQAVVYWLPYTDLETVLGHTKWDGLEEEQRLPALEARLRELLEASPA